MDTDTDTTDRDRWRVNVRGAGTELRGYARGADLTALATATEALGLMIVYSRAEPGWDPFRAPAVDKVNTVE